MVKNWARKIGAAARDAPEAFVAIVLGVVFTGIGILTDIEGKALTEVTLLVLSVLAASVVRDRKSREEATGTLRRVEEGLQSLLGGEPYHVLHHTSAMNVRDGGATGYGTRTKKIRFDRDSVLSMTDRSQSTGRSVSYECRPKPLKKVGRFGTGAKHVLISLGRPYNRGEILDFSVEETLKDAFLEDREDVTVEVLDPTDELVLSVTWAGDRAVDAIYVERSGRQTRVPDSERQPAEGGGFSYARTFEQPRVGESISIVWDWA